MTMFLDEIGELPLDAQVKFLRILEDRLVERVGGSSPIPVDVRVIAATNRNLEELVGAGTFRTDVWYRVRAVRLDLPPLRERREDIPALAQHSAGAASTAPAERPQFTCGVATRRAARRAVPVARRAYRQGQQSKRRLQA